MKISDAMTQSTHMVHVNDTLKKAAQIMARENLGFLPVNDGDRLVGTITDRDIAIRCVAEGKEAESYVRDAMTRDVKYCYEDQEIEEVMENMADIQVRRLPVMSRSKRLVGVLSLADAARHYSPDAAGMAFSGIVAPGGPHSGDPLRSMSPKH